MNALGGLKGSLKFDTIEYTYDSANQIISAGDTVFRHDLKGNMIEKIEPGDGITEAQAEAQAETDNGGSEGNGSNAGSSGGGADSGRASTRYCYNRADRLWKITLPDGNHIKNFYDYDGLRIKKIDVDGKTVKYYWDNNAVIPVVLSERDNSNPVSSYIYDGFSPLFFKTMEPGNPSFATAKNNYYLNDHLSSILALSNENAIITDQYEYDEYGIPVINIGRSSNTNGYTGQDYDDRTGLLYLRARYYEPEMGRFINRDSFYHSSIYEYPENPLTYSDPSGLQPIDPRWIEFLQRAFPEGIPQNSNTYIPVIVWLERTLASGAFGTTIYSGIKITGPAVALYGLTAIALCVHRVNKFKEKVEKIKYNMTCWDNMGTAQKWDLVFSTAGSEYADMINSCYGPLATFTSGIAI